MAGYFSQRLVQSLITALMTSVFIFALLHLAPGDPIAALTTPGMNAEDRDLLARQYGFDQPVATQYVRWLGNTLQGDLGKSIRTREPVTELLGKRFWNTFQVAVLAAIINLIFGVGIGVLAAVRHRTLADKGCMFVATLGLAVPAFWSAVLLALVFSAWLRWLPANGAGTWRHLVLPSLALGIATASLTARMTRSAMLDVLGAAYITAARGRGLSPRSVTLHHALRNALIPVLTAAGQVLGMLIAGAVVTETVFNYPGMGYTLVRAITERDYPVIQGVLLIVSFSYLAINLLIDTLYVAVDPRIRLT